MIEKKIMKTHTRAMRNISGDVELNSLNDSGGKKYYEVVILSVMVYNLVFDISNRQCIHSSSFFSMFQCMDAVRHDVAHTTRTLAKN